MSGRVRTIVTADPELDDLNSLLRLLLYTNEVDLQGLVYASSRFHWRGDGAGTTFFLPDREYDSPQTSWRWAPGERFIHDAVEAYAEAYPNLAVHDDRYPSPDVLRGLIRFGNVDFEGDMSSDTPGSDLIADALLDDDPRPVHIQLWAGPATLARALRSIEERYAETPAWPQVRASVSRRAIVTKFASQDATYDDYILPVWPDIRVTEAAAMAWGYLIRETIRDEDRPLLAAEWMRENVTSAGTLGALYRVWGDGRQMVPGDPTDYFHLSGRSAEELRADPVAWQRDLLHQDHALFEELPVDEVVFTDTSFLETLVFGQRAGITVGPNIEAWLRRKRYQRVFFLDPLEDYQQTAVRMESNDLARQISDQNTDDQDVIPMITLSPQWEQAFAESLVGQGEDKQLSMQPTRLQEFITALRNSFERQAMMGETPVLLTSPGIRPYVRSIIERFRPVTVIMSQNEVHPKAKIKTVGQV